VNGRRKGTNEALEKKWMQYKMPTPH